MAAPAGWVEKFCYRTVADETWHTLAAKLYGDPSMYLKLFNANSDRLSLSNVPMGASVVLPVEFNSRITAPKSQLEVCGYSPKPAPAIVPLPVAPIIPAPTSFFDRIKAMPQAQKLMLTFGIGAAVVVLVMLAQKRKSVEAPA